MHVNVPKLILYVVLTILAVYSGRQFVSRYSRLMGSNVDTDPLQFIDPTPPAQIGETNNVIQDPVGPIDTDPETPGTGDPAAGTETGLVEGDTNLVESTTTPVLKPEPVERELVTKRDFDRVQTADTSGLALYAFGLFGTLLGLGFLAAHDLSSFLGQKAHKLLHNEEGEGIHSASYDKAEDVWASGDYLEAIRLMREYLNQHPREVHVMARIAEIYEKDLGNYLAAALEYEELLKEKLPAERWGWAAIHLVNLYYGKLDKPEQGLALLWRIHREFGQTQAAEKARKRLNQIDPDFAIEQARLDREAAEAAAAAGTEEPEPPEEEDSLQTANPVGSTRAGPAEPVWQPPDEDESGNLPKGFRPKKR